MKSSFVSFSIGTQLRALKKFQGTIQERFGEKKKTSVYFPFRRKEIKRGKKIITA
mgnify:CR=1 FL=1